MSKPKSIILPTEAEVPGLTDRLVEIDREIKKLTLEKKDIEARLDAYALKQPQEPLKDETREGRQVRLPGRRYTLPIIYTSDLMIGSFREGSEKHHELLAILSEVSEAGGPHAGRLIKLFFDEPSKWESRYEDGKKFRAKAAELLPKDVAPKFIAACTQTDKHGVKKSNTAFDYKAATPVDGKEAK